MLPREQEERSARQLQRLVGGFLLAARCAAFRGTTRIHCARLPSVARGHVASLVRARTMHVRSFESTA